MAEYSSLAKLGRIKLPNNNTYALIDKDGRALIAADYKNGRAYAKDDYVVYSDTLYRITQQISDTSNTGWAAVTKTAVTVGSELKALQQYVVNPMHFLGTSSTAISDGLTGEVGGVPVNRISIGGKQVDAAVGDVVLYSGKEYVWGNNQWNEFGSTGSLKDFAFANTGSGTVTYSKASSGSVSVPEGSYTAKYAKIVKKTSGSVATNGSSAAIATVSAPTSPFLTGLPSSNSTANGITELQETTTDVISSIPTASKTVLTGQPTLNLKKLATTSITGISANNDVAFDAVASVGSLPSLTTSVSDDLLTIGWSAGSLPTTSSKTASKITSATAATVATGALESFTGTTPPNAVAVSMNNGSTESINAVGTVAAGNKTSVVTGVSAKSTKPFIYGFGTPSSSNAVTSVTAATTVDVPTSYTVTDPTFELQTSSSSSGTYAAAEPMPYVASASNSNVNKTVTITDTTATASVTVSPN